MKITRKQALCLLAEYLSENNFKKAARLLWPFIVQNSQSDRIWNAITKYDRICIMGHGSASKTFTSAMWGLLDWLSDAESTALVITSDTIASMKRRIWSDFKYLHAKARERIGNSFPGEIMDASNMIRLRPEDGKNAIHAIAAESDDAQSKIQGLHTKRVRVIIDEADNKHSESIWSAIANLGTSGHLKCIALANPVDRYSEFGAHCEPENGWESINPDVDDEWDSKRGWHVVRLDGLKSPNILNGKEDLPFLLTQNGINQILNDNGENSPEYWTYVRAWFPPESTLTTVFIPSILDKCIKNKITWLSSVEKVASFDPAMDGGDQRIMMIGSKGKLSSDPSKTVLKLEQSINIKRKDTSKEPMIDYCDQFIEYCKLHGVEPKNSIIDGTGTTIGFSEYIRHKWSREVKSTNFAGACTEMRVTSDDMKKPSEKYDRFVTELWFAAREWCRLGLVEIENCPRELRIQLESRRYSLNSNKVNIESKIEMKKRGLGSPDYGDAFCLLIHLMRLTEKNYFPGFTKTLDRKKWFEDFRNKNSSNYEVTYGVM